MVVATGKLPNLLIIGAQKCGTTSLHNYLAEHPQVYMSEIKELNFFVDTHGWGNWEKGLEWYMNQFEDVEGVTVFGESSVSYSRWDLAESVAKKLHRYLPGLKIIYIIRDPIDRIVSAYCHLLYDPDWPDVSDRTSLDNIINNGPDDPCTGYLYEILVFSSLYGEIMQVYAKYLDMHNIFVVSLEELSVNPEKVFVRLLKFLGLEYSEEIFSFSRKYNTRGDQRILRFDPMGRVRKYRWAKLVFRIIPKSLKDVYRNIFYKKMEHDRLSKISSDNRPVLKELFKDDMDLLNKLCKAKNLDVKDYCL